MSGTIACKTGSPRPVCAINFSRDQSSDKLINFLDSQLDTRDSILETRYSRLETRYSKLSRIESRGSRIEARGTVNLLLSGIVSVSAVKITLISSSSIKTRRSKIVSRATGRYAATSFDQLLVCPMSSFVGVAYFF